MENLPTHRSSRDLPVGEVAYLPPLFERLTKRGTQFLTAKEVKESVRKSLERLLNTRYVLEPYMKRFSLPKRLAPLRTGNILDYGLEDFAELSMEGDDKIPQKVQTLISIFEPRLEDPTVKICRKMDDGQRAIVEVTGSLNFGKMTQEVLFSLEAELKR